MNLRDARPDELEDWDARTVEAPGGHVYQSRAWAAHRSGSGWRPRFLVDDAGGRALALTRSWPLVGGGSAYIPRGPGPVDAERRRSWRRAWWRSASMLAAEGIDVVAADPEVPDAETGFRHAIEAAGFHPIEEIQPSRHRISLPLGPGADEDAVFEAIAKSTRQRIRGAERAEIGVVRHDARRRRPAGPGTGFLAPAEPAEIALDRFYDLLLETGERRHFSFGPRDVVRRAGGRRRLPRVISSTSRRAPAMPRASRSPGLILYRHGGRLSTVHSGDHDAVRKTHPGALHLLRWRAIQLAIREGCSEMDLGGVDVAGSRGEPHEGDPLYGLYQHKQSFGGQWLALTGAHERVFDPNGYRIGRLAGRAARLVGR